MFSLCTDRLLFDASILDGSLGVCIDFGLAFSRDEPFRNVEHSAFVKGNLQSHLRTECDWLCRSSGQSTAFSIAAVHLHDKPGSPSNM